MSVRRLALTFERCASASASAAAANASASASTTARGLRANAIGSGAERSVPALAELFESGAACAILARRHHPKPAASLPVIVIKPTTQAQTPMTAFSTAPPSMASDVSTAASSDEEVEEDDEDDEDDEEEEEEEEEEEDEALSESSESETECDMEPAADALDNQQAAPEERETERCAMEQNDVNIVLSLPLPLTTEGSSVPTALITASTDASEPKVVARAADAAPSADSVSVSVPADATVSTTDNNSPTSTSATTSSDRRRPARRTAGWTAPTADARFMNYAASERYQAARQAGLARRQRLEQQQQQRRAEEIARAAATVAAIAAQQAATRQPVTRQPATVRGVTARVFGYEQDARFVAQRETNRARIAAIRAARATAAAARFNRSPCRH